MYYESVEKKASCFLAQRTTGVITMRVIMNRQKFERGLFNWPAESWDEDKRMILPRSLRDTEYADYVQQVMATMREALEVIERDDVNNIEDFKRIFCKPEQLMLSEAMEAYIKNAPLAESTKVLCRHRSKKLVATILGDLPICEIKHRHLALIDEHFMQKSKGAALNMHTLLKNTLNHCIMSNEISVNPYTTFKCQVRKKAERRAKASECAVTELFEAFLIEPEGKERQAMRLFLMQAYTGARYSDACRITVDDFERGYFVMQKTSHEAALFMSDKIRQLCPEKPISFNYHQYRWLLKKISIRLGHDFSKTHAARRYFATKIYEKGGKDIKLVQKALGHTSIVSTEKYISVESDALQRAVMSLGE